MLFIHKAKLSELNTVKELLQEEGLSTTGVDKHTFMVAEMDGEIIGTVGLERYGENALLRSLVISPKHRRQLLADGLVKAIMNMADLRGVKRVYGIAPNEIVQGLFDKLLFEQVTDEEIFEACGESHLLEEGVPMAVDLEGYFTSSCSHEHQEEG